ncbi:MAG: hypothetical protein R3D85_10060 [Paracoccaceae bacterium]
MGRLDEFDWKTTTREEQLERLRGASQAELNRVMREYDWSLYPGAVLGHVAAKRGIGLSAALSAFFNGDPWRFNYLPKRDVGEVFRTQASLLDAICQRINAGFYLPDLAPLCRQDVARLDAWIANQRHDQRDHRRGRWVIEDQALEPLYAAKRAELEEAVRRETEAVQGAEAQKAAAKRFSLKGLTAQAG